ncbi:hypothetical protein LZP73_06225 [Shewanella sp. AS16]|uniref:hypothetical protein n=1 Tax=Shewanella sp. AS16 TaxID=2907625 RepID=UPI001F2CCE21|nr:hypothetical protein [Shewanella sp. AS16]MCE9685813.1 hypothetical protein [Shewanella sp. AS16]
MSELNSKAEDAKLVVEYFNRVVGWAAVNIFRRASLLLITVSVLAGGWYWYITDLSGKAISDYELRTIQQTNLSKSNSYKLAMDSIDLCLDAIDKSTDLKDWYCEHALQSYKDRIVKPESEYETEIISKNAYGAMKADLANKERNIKYLELVNKKMTKDIQLIDMLSSSFAIAISIFLMSSVYGFVVYCLYKRSRMVIPDNS